MKIRGQEHQTLAQWVRVVRRELSEMTGPWRVRQTGQFGKSPLMTKREFLKLVESR